MPPALPLTPADLPWLRSCPPTTCNLPVSLITHVTLAHIIHTVLMSPLLRVCMRILPMSPMTHSYPMSVCACACVCVLQACSLSAPLFQVPLRPPASPATPTPLPWLCIYPFTTRNAPIVSNPYVLLAHVFQALLTSPRLRVRVYSAGLQSLCTAISGPSGASSLASYARTSPLAAELSAIWDVQMSVKNQKVTVQLLLLLAEILRCPTSGGAEAVQPSSKGGTAAVPPDLLCAADVRAVVALQEHLTAYIIQRRLKARVTATFGCMWACVRVCACASMCMYVCGALQGFCHRS